MQLDRANRDLALEMLSQRLRIQRLAGLRVGHQQTDLLLRDPKPDQDFDGVALLRVGTNVFRPLRPATPDIKRLLILIGIMRMD